MGRNSKKKLAVEVIIKKYGWIGRGRGAVRTWLVHAFHIQTVRCTRAGTPYDWQIITHSSLYSVYLTPRLS